MIILYDIPFSNDFEPDFELEKQTGACFLVWCNVHEKNVSVVTITLLYSLGSEHCCNLFFFLFQAV